MFRIRSLDAVESTNIEVKRAIDAGEPEGLVVRARRQTGGYGRQGRIWESPVGGLYFSMLLRPAVPAAELSTIALVAGLAVRRGLVRLVRPDVVDRVRVKWPNDIVLAASADAPTPSASHRRYSKLCGISSEARGGAVCVGIGVNVCAPAEARGGTAADADELQGKNVPAYLEDIAVDGSLGDDPGATALSEVLAAFELLYRQWEREGFASLVDEYAAHEALRGGTVDVVDRGGAIVARGAVEGVAADGCLLVRDEACGTVMPVASGEAHIA